MGEKRARSSASPTDVLVSTALASHAHLRLIILALLPIADAKPSRLALSPAGASLSTIIIYLLVMMISTGVLPVSSANICLTITTNAEWSSPGTSRESSRL